MKFFLVASLCLAAVLASPLIAKSSKNARIIGGTDALAGQFPFAAYLEINTPTAFMTCGGTLMTNEYVLTSALCVESATLIRIQLGSNKRTGADANRVTVTTDTYELHPEFNRTSLNNDLALVKLRMPITFTDYIKPISFLPIADLAPSSSGSIIGWGQTSDAQAGDAELLQHARVVSMSNEECKLTYGNQITDNMLCIEGNYNEGTCIGDSGNPMVLVLPFGHHIIVGVSSFHSQNGCESTDPSGFSRIFPAKEWITNVTHLQ